MEEALDVALSSAPRPKTHYRGRVVDAPYTEPDSFATNEARLLLPHRGNLLHAGACLLGRGAARMSRERFPPAPPQDCRPCDGGSRRVTFVIEAARAAGEPVRRRSEPSVPGARQPAPRPCPRQRKYPGRGDQSGTESPRESLGEGPVRQTHSPSSIAASNTPAKAAHRNAGCDVNNRG